MTQCEKVLNYIKENGAITQRDAFNLGIYRLASRISDLKYAGFNIKSTLITVKCADGTKTKVAQYTLEDKTNA